MKAILTIILTLISISMSYGSLNGSFKVEGDQDKFYPVFFVDGAWNHNKPTELYLGRSNIHTDAAWLGSVISKFVFHASLGGHKSNFINADIRQSEITFIAGWKDVTAYNNNNGILIWLRGGGITYYYNSSFEVNPLVYDGVSNALPYHESSAYDPAGTDHTFKTVIDAYVNTQGISLEHNAYFNGTGTSFFAGKLAVGTTDTRGYHLAINGKIRAQEVKVETANWPDYVFKDDYKLPTLRETENHIKAKGHLPGIPSAAEVQAKGIDLGEMNAKLLQKIEELTLHLIAKDKQLDLERIINRNQEERLKNLEINSIQK